MKNRTKWIISGSVATSIIIAAGLATAANYHHGEQGHGKLGAHKDHQQMRFGKKEMTLDGLQASLNNRFSALDANNDGMISQDEFSAQALSRFTTIDADNNGELTRDEIKQARKAKKQERRHKKNASDTPETDTPATDT